MPQLKNKIPSTALSSCLFCSLSRTGAAGDLDQVKSSLFHGIASGITYARAAVLKISLSRLVERTDTPSTQKSGLCVSSSAERAAHARQDFRAEECLLSPASTPCMMSAAPGMGDLWHWNAARTDLRLRVICHLFLFGIFSILYPDKSSVANYVKMAGPVI